MNKFERKGTYAPIAREMRAAGSKLVDIAERFGISQMAARDWVKGVACPVDHQAEHNRRIARDKAERNEPVKAVARKMRSEGATFDAIVQALRISKPTAIAWCRGVSVPVKQLTPEQIRQKQAHWAWMERREAAQMEQRA